MMCGVPLGAKVMTLTDKEGRSIEADVISVDDGVLKIKRGDGMSFDLPLNKLDEADQKKVAEWAAEEAAREAAMPLPAHAFDLTVSRANFDTQKSSRKVQFVTTYTDGSTKTETKTEYTVNEQWGYGITVTNRLLKPIQGLRLEYRVFTKQGNRVSASAQGTLPIGTLKSRDTQTFKTSVLPASYSYIQGNPIPRSSSANIYGIRLRIYRGNTLEKEYATPETLLADAW